MFVTILFIVIECFYVDCVLFVMFMNHFDTQPDVRMSRVCL